MPVNTGTAQTAVSIGNAELDSMSKYILMISWLIFCGPMNGASAQTKPVLQTTAEAIVYAGPGSNFAAVGTFPAQQRIIIIQPKSVFIGKGVSIGQGVLIEGKPWHQVQLPDGQTGYLSGSLICSSSTKVVGISGLCQGQ